MDIEKIFSFLVTDYGLDFRFQKFKGCFKGNWVVYTYSYYNESGCFTIHLVPERGECDLYSSECFSENREDLTKELLNSKVYKLEKAVWGKYEKRCFHQYRTKLYLKTVAEVIRLQIEKNSSFFNIQVKN